MKLDMKDANSDLRQSERDTLLMSYAQISREELNKWQNDAKSEAEIVPSLVKNAHQMAVFTKAGSIPSNRVTDHIRFSTHKPQIAGVRRVNAPLPTVLGSNEEAVTQFQLEAGVNCNRAIVKPDVNLGRDSCPFLVEEEVKDEGMKQYTAILMDSINNSVVFEGDPDMGIENVSKMDQSSKFIEMIEDSLLPIRQDGWFREGVKKTRKTRHLIVHHPNLLSHTYLQSHLEGVLHVLPGWTRKLLISSIAYRFESSGTTQYRTPAPFFGGLHFTVKTYNCAGVLVCKRCSSEFRERGRHIVVHPNDYNVLDCAEDLSPAAEARKKVIGLYMGMEAKKKTRAGFCQAEVRETLGGQLSNLEMVPSYDPRNRSQAHSSRAVVGILFKRATRPR